MIFNGPPMTNMVAHMMHGRHGIANTRQTLRRRAGWHTKPRPYPTPPFFGNPPYPPKLAAQDFLRLVGNAWLFILNPFQRALWAALAATQPAFLDDGSVKFLTPSRFFTWFNTTAYMRAYRPTNPMAATSADISLVPPATWDQPITPSAPVNFNFLLPLVISFDVQTTGNLVNPSCSILVMSPYRRKGDANRTPRIRTQTTTSFTSTAGGILAISANLYGVGNQNTIRTGTPFLVRVISPPPNFVPSAPAIFQWP